MFLHMDHPEQARELASLIAFHADNREDGTRITISSHECEGAFEGCVVFTTTSDFPERKNVRGDRIVVAPNGSTLHIS